MKYLYTNRQHWHPLLIALTADVEYTFTEVSGKEPIMSSDYRPDDPGTHGTIPLRSIDLVGCSDAEMIKIATIINSRWHYDENRRQKVCVIPHDAGDGMHLHLQVHPNTVKR